MINYLPIIQKVVLPNKQSIDVLRLDSLHPIISGNKWFKLKHNIENALKQNKKTILSFGGAHSNHLAAAAMACEAFERHFIAVVRAEENTILSPTLLKAKESGTQIVFVSREMYRQKTSLGFIEQLHERFGDFYLIPEGGNNEEGILGCMEILQPLPTYDYVFCACGSGATLAGLIASKKATTTIVGISVLKGENTLALSIASQLRQLFPEKKIKLAGQEILNENHIDKDAIINTYAFSGFAKMDKVLIDFKMVFEKENAMPLDYIYTNKLFYGINDLLQQQKISSSAKILAIHSGGLQGNQAFEERYGLSQ